MDFILQIYFYSTSSQKSFKIGIKVDQIYEMRKNSWHLVGERQVDLVKDMTLKSGHWNKIDQKQELRYSVNIFLFLVLCGVFHVYP